MPGKDNQQLTQFSHISKTHAQLSALPVQDLHQLALPESLSGSQPLPADLFLYKYRDMLDSIWPVIAPSARLEFPSFATLYMDVFEHKLPNYIGAQIPLKSGLKVEQWELALQVYHDKDICKFIKYGWPLGYLADAPPVSVADNHNSALQHEAHITEFIRVESQHQAILGPFEQPPFTPWTRCSPLMTRPKKDSQTRRVIVDLSFPQGSDVNSAIDITSYMGRDITFKLPAVSDLVAKLQVDGPGAYIWKADLSRAYCQLRIDPLDAPLTGIKFKNQYFIDLCPPFGCRSSSAACQRVSNAVAYIMGQAGYFMLAYLDDYAACEPNLQKATESYQHFMNISASLGLDLALKKCLKPSKSIEWLGYQIDVQAMTLSIPKQKMDEVLRECSHWTERRRANKRMIQSLLGKLIHISNGVAQARRFVSRILEVLRQMGDREWTTLSFQFKKDIWWFLKFASMSNGIRLIAPAAVTLAIECDSSLDAGGGVAAKWCYTWKYDDNIKSRFKAIHELEALNLVIAYKTFARQLNQPNVNVVIFTDNQASSFALQTGKTKDSSLAACARELWLAAALHQHEINIQHKLGVDIELADALSRLHLEPLKADFVKQTISSMNLVLIPPYLSDIQFFDKLI